RPYALGTAVACLAVWALVRWLDVVTATGLRPRRDLEVPRRSGDLPHWVYGAIFVVAAAVLWRVHLLYWPFYLVLAIYGGRRAWPLFAAAALLLIPVATEAWALRRGAGLHVMTAVPEWRALLDSLKPGLVAGPAAVAVFWRRR